MGSAFLASATSSAKGDEFNIDAEVDARVGVWLLLPVLSKLLVWTVLGIFLGKLVFRRQFKGLGAQMDRLVNATIVAFLLAYVILAVVECQGRKKAETVPVVSVVGALVSAPARSFVSGVLG